MSVGVFILLLADLAYIGALPRIFFRSDGKLNLKWWLTATPFFLSAVIVALQYFGITNAWYGADWRDLTESVTVILATLSIALISFTLGTHRRRLSLWHQNNDAPEEIVTYGAYRFIRHPFYTSFILALLATVTQCLSLWSIAICVYGMFILNYTAAKEEEKLQNSQFGSQYTNYKKQSGRFFPKLWQVHQ